MNDSKISVRYSRALFQSALDKNLVDSVSNDMKYITAVSYTHLTLPTKRIV